jgi:hypothetical protein
VGKIVEGLTMTTALYLNSGGRFFWGLWNTFPFTQIK